MGRTSADRELDAVLAELLAHTGAQAARVVNGRTGQVIADVGVEAGDDVATLVRLARDTVPTPAPDGGLDDLVVSTGHAVHVLRTTEVPGTFLHVRLDHGRGDVAAARRGLAASVLQRAVRAALLTAPVETGSVEPGSDGPGPTVPQQRAESPPAESPPAESPPAESPPAESPPAEPRDPALALLAMTGPGARSGVIAARALGSYPNRSLDRRTPLTSVLPPRDAAPAFTAPPVLRHRWARDEETLRRVMVGLQRLK